MAAATYLYLPYDCWETVIRFIINNDDENNNRHSMISLSAVSKQFLAITDRFTGRFRFLLPLRQNRTQPLLHRLYRKFSILTSLNLSRYSGYDLDDLLCQISRFPTLKITSLNLSYQPTVPENGLRAISQNNTILTSLTCSHIYDINATHLFFIAECFPLLEELDLSHVGMFMHTMVDETESYVLGVQALSLALFKLRKVNLSYFPINNQSLFHLFNNCKLLQEVNIFGCRELTNAGIASALRERPKLTSLLLSISLHHDEFTASHLIDSLVSLKSLTCLGLSALNISDELLYTIARKRLPLTRLVLKYCSGRYYNGLFYLLSMCHKSFQHLDLEDNRFLNDQHVVELSSFLGDLVSVNLSNCSKITESALFALARKCPLLGEITMENIRGSVANYESPAYIGVHPQLKSLYLGKNSWLSDANIIMFASIFPNLEVLDFNSCNNISKGICQVLRRCCKIRHLNLAFCKKVKLLGMNFVVPMLEVLNLSNTNVNDKTLYLISKNCIGLMQLSLQLCNYVTEEGVKHVVENCTRLQEIYLGDIHLSDKTREIFSHHGCHLY
ncbi:F-box/LRR protein [Medicago truncatula]|uniref:F-box/LRR protein n=2 Tax=Medicago truncatula TaxID=3880 RepID=A0A072UHK6_MEDTR|nr:F-box/LRR protein [Medicago truncatula]